MLNSKLNQKSEPSMLSRIRSQLQMSLVFGLSILALSACDGNYMVWSSDGKLAAVIGSKGLRVIETEDSISPVLVDRAGMFRWIPQEHEGLVVNFDYVRSWADLKPILSAEQEKQIIQEAAILRKKVFTYHGDRKKFEDSALRVLGYPLPAALYLRSNSSVDFEKLTLKKWPAYAAVKVPIFNIKTCSIQPQSARLGRTIDRGIDEIIDLRVSPNGKYLACVKHRRPKETNYLSVFSLSGPEKLVNIAADTAVYPDWSADSHSIFYSRLNSAAETKTLKIPDLHEGGLFKLDIVDGAGKLLAKKNSQRLANLLFDVKAPIRALKDGRVLFLSRELRFPEAAQRVPLVALFAYKPVDGGTVETVFRKDKDLTYFEPNPDQEQIAVVSASAINVIKSNGSDPVEVCNGKDIEASGILPQWKSNSELSYDAKIKTANTPKPGYAVMLWSRASGNKDISKSWNKDAVTEVSVHRDLFQDAVGKIVEEMDKSAKKPSVAPKSNKK